MAPKFNFRSLCPAAPKPASDAPADMLTGVARRAGRLRILLKLHWISSAICLLGMVLFSATGITLNHAGLIEARPVIVRHKAVLPADLLAGLQRAAASAPAPHRPPPEALAQWLERSFPVAARAADADWSDDEIYLPLPRPGGDAWIRVDLAGGEVECEITDRGWISWLNDLHKGRHTGGGWSLFIDLFAVGCLVFSVSGLLILKMHAAQRLSTWPLVGLGVLIPLLIALLSIH